MLYHVYISRILLQAIIISIILLQAGVIGLMYSNSNQGGQPLTDGKVLFQASKSGVYMSSLLFQGFTCNGVVSPTPTDMFPSLQSNFVNGSPALLLSPAPISTNATVNAGIVMAYGL